MPDKIEADFILFGMEKCGYFGSGEVKWMMNSNDEDISSKTTVKFFFIENVARKPYNRHAKPKLFSKSSITLVIFIRTISTGSCTRIHIISLLHIQHSFTSCTENV